MSTRRFRTLMATVAVLATAMAPATLVAPTAAAASTAAAPARTSAPPDGWTVTRLDSGVRLQWRTPVPQPMGDARIEFFAGDRSLGVAQESADRRTFTLDVPALAAEDLDDLRVRAAGRRLDRRDPAPRTAPRATPPPRSGAGGPTAPVDPGTPGPYTTVTGEYALDAVTLPAMEEPVEMRAVVVAPRTAPGRRPLVLFLHGRHTYCYGDEETQWEWPCAPGNQPVPSHRGYLASQRLLASQGYVTVSISANGINAQDGGLADAGAQARSSLLRLHLARWAQWAKTPAGAPAVVRRAPRADLSRVLLVGHSRGGEGANRAAVDSLTPPPAAVDGYHGPVRWRIRGLFLIAPTIFGQNPAPDVPSITVLPGCDGDVSDLQGQQYLDATRGVSRGAALHSALYVVGANHNYFNTEWTPGLAQAPAWDDWWDADHPICGTVPSSLRITPQRQQAVGSTYVAAAARQLIADDDRVLPLLDGTGATAPTTGSVQVLAHAIGAHREPFVVPGPTLRVTAAGSTSARLCDQVTPYDDPAGCATDLTTSSPHFVPFQGLSHEGGRHAVEVSWTAGERHAAVLRLPQPRSLARAGAVALRVVVPPQPIAGYDPARRDTRFDIAVTDTHGRRAVLGTAALAGLPNQFSAGWAQEVRVRTDTARRARVDLRQVVRLDLIPRSGTGRLWLIDAWGWNEGTPPVTTPTLRRVDVGDLGDVTEGDSGVDVYRMPVTVSPGRYGKVRVFVQDWYSAGATERVVTVRPGARTIDVPIEVTGNTSYGGDRYLVVLVKSVQGSVIGDEQGILAVIENDPLPVVTVHPTATRVTEGETLRWQLNVSGTADFDLALFLQLQPPTTGPELSTTDVPEQWLNAVLGVEPLPSRPLSATGWTSIIVNVPIGARTLALEIPTVADDITEPEEYVQLLTDPQYFPEPAPVLTGSVIDP
jgi:hypothetical protein